MKIVKASYVIETEIDGQVILKNLEKFIRTAYRSEDIISKDSHLKIVKKILMLQHESTLEAESITVRIKSNIGFTREMNRHRHLSIVEQSTRYCNMSKDKFGNEITFVEPPTFNQWSEPSKQSWRETLTSIERSYMEMINDGLKPQEAREILPLCTYSEACYVGNLREWRHILKLRTSNAAHPSMHKIMIPLLKELKMKIPLIFDDITY